MIEVAPNLFVGPLADFEALPDQSEYRVVFGCKDPSHRQAVGYTTKALPRDYPEYLWAYRNDDGHLFLNLIDPEDPKYVPETLVAEAVGFARGHLAEGRKTMVLCNQGLSRSPTLAMLILAPSLHSDFLTAEEMFSLAYPPFKPGKGMRAFAQEHWGEYFGGATCDETSPVQVVPAHPADSLKSVESITEYLRGAAMTVELKKAPAEGLLCFVKTALVALDRIGNPPHIRPGTASSDVWMPPPNSGEQK